jgi:hypothetical protein
MNVEVVFENVLNEYKEKRIDWELNKFKSLNTVKELKKLSIDEKRNLIFYCIQYENESNIDKFNVANQLIFQLLEKPVFQTESQILEFHEKIYSSKFFHFDGILDQVLLQIKNFIEQTGQVSSNIKSILNSLKLDETYSYSLTWNEKIDNIINVNTEEKFVYITKHTYFSNQGVIGEYLYDYFDKCDKKKVNLLTALMMEQANSKPSARWVTGMKSTIKEYGEEQYVEFATVLFKNVIQFLNDVLYSPKFNNIESSTRMSIMSGKNEDFIRNVIWGFSLIDFEKYLDVLIDLAKWAYKKIPWYSAVQPRIGASLIYLFSQMPAEKSIPILTLIRKHIKQNQALKLIDKYIAELALKSGKTKDQMEDENVPHFDLDSHREKEFTYGNITAKVSITTYNTVSLEWSVDQKPQKSVPAQMKTEYPAELKALQKQVKEIKETLSAQTKRVESFYLAERNWNFEEWNPFFHEHGLMSAISRPLIWQFTLDDKKIALMYIDDVWKDENDDVVDISGQNPSLCLWHPIHASADSVMRWRQILQKYKITQPVKQAYREVYILTEAEANTRSYSNRFAAHILKNYQFGALCKLRNWKGFNQFHGGGTPELTIKNHKIKVQYYVDFAHYDNSGQYLTTDQVRFYKNNEQMDLVDVPKILFSEALRDVDMFVGVCSIGNDAAWRDGGHQFGQDYWQSYSFGDLSEVAKTRKEILTGILSKLKVAKVSHIDGNFLVVKGKIRTYKIHLGSTNILMEPNNQYLCIVQDRSSSAGAKLFIPFEGDEGLSIIISKALLLAEDDKISDSSIVSQIKIR